MFKKWNSTSEIKWNNDSYSWIKKQKIKDIESFLDKVENKEKQIMLNKTKYWNIKWLLTTLEYNLYDKYDKLIVFSNEDLNYDSYWFSKFESPFLTKFENILKWNDIKLIQCLFKVIPYWILKEYIHKFDIDELKRETFSSILEEKLKQYWFFKRISTIYYYWKSNDYSSQEKINWFECLDEYLKEKEKNKELKEYINERRKMRINKVDELHKLEPKKRFITQLLRKWN